MIKFPIKNRWSGKVIFEAEIDCSEATEHSINLGLAVKAAVKAGAYLEDAILTGGVNAYGYKFTKTPIQLYERYRIEIWQGFMKIGCEEHLLSDWKKFTQKKIIEMEGKEAAIWWKKWKPVLFALAEAGDRLEPPEQGKT